MAVRGLRGASSVQENTAEAITQCTRELMAELIRANGLEPDQIAAIWLTLSPDLNAAFPAVGVRLIPGWERVPLMCAQEIAVPGSLSRCVRLMLLVNTEQPPAAMKHVYLREAVALRPDLNGR